MVLMNGEIDRACGDKRKCAGRDPRQRTKRSIIDETDARKRRIGN
jgi:hypothetical protein